MIGSPERDRDASGVTARARLGASQPAIAAYLDDRIPHARARAVACELIEHLLAAYARWVTPAARIGAVEIDRAEAALGAPSAPPTHWSDSLPLAVRPEHRGVVSRAIKAVATALETSRDRADAKESRAPARAIRPFRRSA